MQIAINNPLNIPVDDITIVIHEGETVYVVEDENVDKVKTADPRTRQWIVKTNEADTMYIPKRMMDIYFPRIIKNGYKIAIIQQTY